MALFFDQDWFDAQLKTRGLSRDDAARALGLSPSEIAEIWKDQRELMARDVLALARLLGASPADVADRAGVSTPVPDEEEADASSAAMLAKLDELAERVGRVERAVVELKALILDLARKE
ncbi:helix-turn-helix domain-containing protein [Tepidicaulis sp. LMO-SS28]|uniref:helix-turn-helix domain-containing protein n=1 Tax=Tepidicaulis sp. LMO-SS28 TaxID=3447455 RepID=UPI003EDF3FF4